nr:tetratricopeptide repeat protein [Ardenticatena sp.]
MKPETEALFKEGIRALHERHFKRAIEALEAAHAAEPDDVDILLNLGGAYILAGMHKKAQPLLERAAELAPDNANAWINLAAARLGPLETSTPERQAGAIDAWLRALEADPDAPNVHYMLGLVHHHRGDYADAERYFTEALRVNPHDTDAKTMLERTRTAMRGED